MQFAIEQFLVQWRLSDLQPSHFFFSLKYPKQMPQLIPQGAIRFDFVNSTTPDKTGVSPAKTLCKGGEDAACIK